MDTNKEWVIYFNPRCGTCRNVLAALMEKKVQPKIIEYLKTPPTPDELDAILKKGDLQPQDIVREKEDLYEELGLADKELSRAEWLKILAENPILIQRPLVVTPNTAKIIRPVEKIAELF